MVEIPLPDGTSFCIDSTEVTIADYTAFLQAKYPLANQPSFCASNDTFDSGNVPVPFIESLPQVYIDWCDAYAYCAWAGKRMCGRIGGGSLTIAEYADPTKSQWVYACTGGGTKIAPYGDTYEPKVCVTEEFDGVAGYQADADVLRPVKSAPACVGGFDGLFDMSGNAAEFEDAASAMIDEHDSTVIMGDSASHGLKKGICVTGTASKRFASWSMAGIRCCKD
jgi:formylglycine-generating enzyme required for sulfatase activity